MATSKEFLTYVLDQLSEVDGISHRAMMGEYILYKNGKIAAYLCDGQMLVKPVPAAKALLPDAPLADMPYVDPNETVDGIALTDWAAYIGGAAHSYLYKFKRMAFTGRPLVFSLWAMLFGPLFFFYRKMWKAAAVFSVLHLLTELPSVLALLVATESPFFVGLSYELLVKLNNAAVVVAWLVRAAAALLAVDLYRRDAGGKINRILQQYPAGRDRQIALSVHGGVSMPAVLLAVVGFMLLCYCIVPLMGPNLSVVYQMMGG